MNSTSSQLTKLMANKHVISVTNQQFDLLTRLLKNNSLLTEKISSEFSEIFKDLDEICSLTNEISEKVNLVYQYVSVSCQLSAQSVLEMQSDCVLSSSANSLEKEVSS